MFPSSLVSLEFTKSILMPHAWLIDWWNVNFQAIKLWHRIHSFNARCKYIPLSFFLFYSLYDQQKKMRREFNVALIPLLFSLKVFYAHTPFIKCISSSCTNECCSRQMYNDTFYLCVFIGMANILTSNWIRLWIYDSSFLMSRFFTQV